jgi:hypothetical protein
VQVEDELEDQEEDPAEEVVRVVEAVEVVEVEEVEVQGCPGTLWSGGEVHWDRKPLPRSEGGWEKKNLELGLKQAVELMVAPRPVILSRD